MRRLLVLTTYPGRPPGDEAQGGPAAGERDVKKGRTLVALLVLSVAAIAGLAFWDEQRESAAALEDFAQDQTTLAENVAAELATHLAEVRRDARLIAADAAEGRRTDPSLLDGYSSFQVRPASAARAPAPRDGFQLSVPAPGGLVVDLVVPSRALLGGSARIARPGALLLLVAPPEGTTWSAVDGRSIAAEELLRGFEDGAPSIWLTRAQAARLGLPPRLAAAGLAPIDGGPLGRFRVAVVSSAERVRDRERRAEWRLVLGVLLAGGLVFTFGSVALRTQRRELVLERELAVADLERERDARLATASRAATMGTLAMGIAHEVSTPLGIIAGRAEQILPRVAGDERGTRGMQAILEQAERIRRVIRGFLDLARGGAPELRVAPPEAVLRAAQALVEHRFAKAGVRLTVTAAAADLPPIRCDLPMLEQALVNLLLNACDACERGGHVSAAVECDEERVSFVVTDDGVGISPEAKARATEPFFTTKAAGKGTGLGLAITSEIVKIHRGTLDIGPAGARGTRVAVSLPKPAKTERDAAA